MKLTKIRSFAVVTVLVLVGLIYYLGTVRNYHNHAQRGSTIAHPRGQSVDPLARFAHADPLADLVLAIRSNDCRFLAVKGYGLVVPGVPDYGLEQYTNGVNVIEGTSDEHFMDRLQIKAILYAETYNTLLLHYIKNGVIPRLTIDPHGPKSSATP
jgi:hypothetical protein